MAAQRFSVPTYLTEEERKDLKWLASEWGCSMSVVLIRLIREKVKELRSGS